MPLGQKAARVIGVVGARGGAGASVFAASLASAVAARVARDPSRSLRSLSSRPGAVLVDLDPVGGGLDVLLGLEEQPGVRWADLREARGQIAGADLIDLLPRWGKVAVVSVDRHRPAAIELDVTLDVLTSLASQAPVILDLPRSVNPSIATLCDGVLLVVPRDLVSVAGAQVVLAGVDPERVQLVVRGPAAGGLDPGQVSRALGLPLAAWMRAQSGLAAGVERGAGPLGGTLARASRRALDSMDEHLARLGPRAPMTPGSPQ